MNFGRPSRQDDMISLCYFLLHMGDPNLFKTSHLTVMEQFEHLKNLKKEMTPAIYCITSKTKQFLPFISEVWGLQYEEEPNYNKLKFLLTKILLENDVNLNDIQGQDQIIIANFEDLQVADEEVMIQKL